MEPRLETQTPVLIKEDVMSNYEYSTRDARGITFEDALNPTSTIRFTRVVSPKTVDGVKLINVRSDTVVVRSVDPRFVDCRDCTTVLEPLSYRLITSGSITSKAEGEKALATLLWNVWNNRDALLRGSLPSSTALVTVDPVITITKA